MPKRDAIVSQLPEESKEARRELRQMLDKNGQEKLDKRTLKIRQIDELIAFIDASLHNQKTYRTLLKLLPACERIELEKKFESAVDLEEEKAILTQNLCGLTVFMDSDMKTQQNYMDLLDILPEDESIALKNAVVNAKTPDEVDQLIASKLPQELINLDTCTREKLAKCPNSVRKEILKNAMEKEGRPINAPIAPESNELDESGKATVAPHQKKPVISDKTKMALSMDEASRKPIIKSKATISSSEVNLNELIEQKIQEQVNHPDDSLQDEWGPKLPLKGNTRKHFLNLIEDFAESDRKDLKKLFDQTDPESIKRFLSVYDTGYSVDEFKQLLDTLICLYRDVPHLTIKMCNDGNTLTTGDELAIWRRTNGNQRELLTRLRDLLSDLSN
ncbi:hypothetical protein [Candidatus Cardinium hertigii]|jgi:hypothetical protein|uniref:Uncharacterized protein n=1 Tax=Candidatus Cardinium hertigii TaxID=247481 RepID=A0A3N2QBC5_9BACT|nr:hypothetical protein [Candidatus Cardinium hertigii]ROT47061.1 hypothetical protein EDM02_04175 [Candidatus Cardinium hertigii]